MSSSLEELANRLKIENFKHLNNFINNGFNKFINLKENNKDEIC